MVKFLCVGIVTVLVFIIWAKGCAEKSLNEVVPPLLKTYGGTSKAANGILMVGLTLIEGAAAKGVCLDGTVPAYHLHRGYGLGANSWLIHLQGGARCNDIRSCTNRKYSAYGSSTRMETEISFTGILSNAAEKNPGMGLQIFSTGIEYCFAIVTALLFLGTAKTSGSDYSSAARQKERKLQFRGQRIWLSAMEDLMSKGMRDANECFFPENFIANIRTPLFILNSAYDSWQIPYSLAPPSADPHGEWKTCRLNLSSCSASQMEILQGFRNQFLNAVKQFSVSKQNGMFINSCFTHLLTLQGTWFARNSPAVGNKTIAEAVGDWYFDRAEVKVVDESCRRLALK
ncbi:pectin acetylesterase 10-like [Malus domestica]|uniref:pectin acetylesterase 10-like n=1 Tax=Malus domestica TaxID=3750 RepID=UPI003974D3FE